MLKIRVIPTLLMKNNGLVKGQKFVNHKYVGDPINAIKIFNDKEVDELVLLDINATITGTPINFSLLEEIAGEAFMPMAYGGGIKTINDMDKIFSIGFEKVVLNTVAIYNPELIQKASNTFGNQSIVVSIDVKKTLLGNYTVFIKSGTVKVNKRLDVLVREIAALGAGEIIINSIDREGTLSGYDMDLVGMVSKSVTIPVIASGGAGTMDDFRMASQAGASAVAAGALFVFHGPHRAVLITYPKYKELEKLFED